LLEREVDVEVLGEAGDFEGAMRQLRRSSRAQRARSCSAAASRCLRRSEGFYVKPSLRDGGARPPIAVKGCRCAAR
jgi:hypothetical protein